MRSARGETGASHWLARVALTLALVAAAVGARAESVEIEMGAATRYLANSTDPGLEMTWAEPDFVEGPEWSDGTFGIGYDVAPPGSGAHALLQTVVPDGTVSVYTRTTFDIGNLSSIFSVFLGVDYDDGVVAWVN